MTSPAPITVFRDPVLLLAFGGGSGLSPVAPGTAGSLLAIALFPLLALLPLPAYLLFVAVFSLAGVWICGRAAEKLGVHDHGGIVIDEMAGMWLAMIAVPPTLPWTIAGFVLFRFFDIVKPWPIGLIDRHVQGGLGIMLDDLLAGVAALLILTACRLLT